MSRAPQYFLHVGLIVTGEAEEEHLTKLFGRIAATGLCSFKVLRRIGQLQPRSSVKRLEMVGQGGRIPTHAEKTISFPSRKFLRHEPGRLLLLIDDLEYKRRSRAEEIFELYRGAMDKLLADDERRRASVHFLVYMLEAYFLADPRAVEESLGIDCSPPTEDVETIRHAKTEIKKLYPSYREREHGGKILDAIDLGRVLGDPQTCAWLRASVAWLVQALRWGLDKSLHSGLDEIARDCHLDDGRSESLILLQKPPTSGASAQRRRDP